MLAAGWRAVHYVSAGIYEESGDRKAERGDVPHADLRRADDGNALADAEAWSGAFSSGEGEESRRQNSGERGDWRRSGDGAFRDAADSAGPRRDDVCGLPAARTSRDGDLRDQRSGGARERGDCTGGPRQSE